MNQRKAKTIRRLVGFDPHADRTYSGGQPHAKGPKDNRYVVTGTITATGKRRAYQDAK